VREAATQNLFQDEDVFSEAKIEDLEIIVGCLRLRKANREPSPNGFDMAPETKSDEVPLL
jgi:hypothetical protein